MKGFRIPDEVKTESYERPLLIANFEKLALTVKLKPGYNGIGAILSQWIDAITVHDEAVKVVEEKMEKVELLKEIYHKLNRAFQHWTVSWTALNTNPEEYNEYVDLLSTVTDYEDRIKLITDPEAKAKAKVDYNRYLELKPLNARLREAELHVVEAKLKRDDALRGLVEAEAELNSAKAIEKKSASLISNDHVTADTKGILIGDLFPQIYTGYILSQLNDEDVESLDYDSVMKKVLNKKLPVPSRAGFKRYDYRYDFVADCWRSLEELRSRRIYTTDPRIPRAQFVTVAASGDYEQVESLLIRGADALSKNSAGTSALHAAAANGHDRIVQLLQKAGAPVECRDKNLMTPFLSAVRRNLLGMAQLLVSLGADVYASDVRHRNAVYFAVCSGSAAMLEYILSIPPALRTITTAAAAEGGAGRARYGVVGRDVDPEVWSCNQAEAAWGYTTLHSAASRGDVTMTRLLLARGASIYRLTKSGKAAEAIAEEGRHVDVVAVLKGERITAPGQLVLTSRASGSSIWIGGLSALDPRWQSETHITHVLCLQHKSFVEKYLPGHPSNSSRGTPSDLYSMSLRLQNMSSNQQILLHGTVLSLMNGVPIDIGSKALESDNIDDVSRHASKFVSSGRDEDDGDDRGHYSDDIDIDLAPLTITHDDSSRDLDMQPEKSSELQTNPALIKRLIILDVDDEDELGQSWLEFSKQILVMLNFLRSAMKTREANVLICDTSGRSTSAAALCLYSLLTDNVDIEESVRICTEARPAVRLSRSLRHGLDKLQRLHADKKLDRLRQRVRKSPALSIAF